MVPLLCLHAQNFQWVNHPQEEDVGDLKAAHWCCNLQTPTPLFWVTRSSPTNKAEEVWSFRFCLCFFFPEHLSFFFLFIFLCVGAGTNNTVLDVS